MNEMIERCAKIAPELKEMYNNEEAGIIAVNAQNGTVHMTNEAFVEIFKNKKIITKERTSDEEYPLEFSVEYKGVKFFCIGKKL